MSLNYVKLDKLTHQYCCFITKYHVIFILNISTWLRVKFIKLIQPQSLTSWWSNCVTTAISEGIAMETATAATGAVLPWKRLQWRQVWASCWHGDLSRVTKETRSDSGAEAMGTCVAMDTDEFPEEKGETPQSTDSLNLFSNSSEKKQQKESMKDWMEWKACCCS